MRYGYEGEEGKLIMKSATYHDLMVTMAFTEIDNTVYMNRGGLCDKSTPCNMLSMRRPHAVQV